MKDTKERCEPGIYHSLQVGSGLTRTKRIEKVVLTPSTYICLQHELLLIT